MSAIKQEPEDIWNCLECGDSLKVSDVEQGNTLCWHCRMEEECPEDTPDITLNWIGKE